MTGLKSRSTTSELRADGRTVFVPAGAAQRASFTTQTKMILLMTFTKHSVGVMASGLVGGVGGVIAKLSVPTWLLFVGGRIVGSTVFTYMTHQCQSTLGCWPQEPDAVSVNGTWSACRLPEKAREADHLSGFFHLQACG